MQNEYELKLFEELTPAELYGILKLRMEIFIVEQQRSYKEIDGNDSKALHYFKKENDEIIAYARIFEAGVTFDCVSIGRIVVKENYRKVGLGRELVHNCIQIAKQKWNSPIKISAQLHLENFYRSFGFEPISEIYNKDKVPHLNMILN